MLCGETKAGAPCSKPIQAQSLAQHSTAADTIFVTRLQKQGKGEEGVKTLAALHIYQHVHGLSLAEINSSATEAFLSPFKAAGTHPLLVESL